MQMNAGGCCCSPTCGAFGNYVLVGVKTARESHLYYGMNTPSSDEYYNQYTGTTQKYTDTASNIGRLDDIEALVITPSVVCDWHNVQFGYDNFKEWIRRGKTICIMCEVSGCFTPADKSIVDTLLSQFGAAGLGVTIGNLYSGCQTVVNTASANALNVDLDTWGVGGSSAITVSGSAKAIVAAGGYVLVGGVVSSLSGNTGNGKVLLFGDANMLNSCAIPTMTSQLLQNICDADGLEI